MDQPKNIFEIINLNVAAVAQDICYLCNKTNELEQKIDAIYRALYPQELPNADGEVIENSQVVSEND